MDAAPLGQLSPPIWCSSLLARQAAANIHAKIAFSAFDGILKWTLQCMRWHQGFHFPADRRRYISKDAFREQRLIILRISEA
jgi:hypothetical protein